MVEATDDSGIDGAFAAALEQHARALIVQVDPFLDGRREKIAALAARYGLPAIGSHPEFATSGGLVSYGNSLPEVYRLEGQRVGKAPSQFRGRCRWMPPFFLICGTNTVRGR